MNAMNWIELAATSNIVMSYAVKNGFYYYRCNETSQNYGSSFYILTRKGTREAKCLPDRPCLLSRDAISTAMSLYDDPFGIFFPKEKRELEMLRKRAASCTRKPTLVTRRLHTAVFL